MPLECTFKNTDKKHKEIRLTRYAIGGKVKDYYVVAPNESVSLTLSGVDYDFTVGPCYRDFHDFAKGGA